MTIPATHCEAKKHGYRQTQDGIVVSFVLHPNEVPDDLALAALGTRYMLVFTRIGDDEEPQAPEVKRPGRPFASLARSQQAGILCNDETFQKWVGRQGGQSFFYPENSSGARQFVLAECEISSRRELDVSDEAGERWDALRGAFEKATGRTTDRIPGASGGGPPQTRVRPGGVAERPLTP